MTPSESGLLAPDGPSPAAVPPRMAPPSPAPLRQLARLGALAAVVFGALLLHAGGVEAGAGRAARSLWGARPDSTDSTDADSLGLDSLALDPLGARPDSLDPDSTDRVAAADTVVADTTERALRYLPGVPGAVRGYSVSVVPPPLPGLRGRLGTYWRRTVTLDSTAYTYAVREAVGETDVRAPADVSFSQYLLAQRQAALANGFRTMASQRTDAGRRRQGVGFTVDIPGGQSSAFRTLFGKNEVDLTVSGRSDVDLGVNYNANELNQAITGQGGSIDPAFGQELNLNVAGTIGDKLRINVNYDTQSEFEFENQVSLVYTGYADDIIQRVEAGNVFLQTPSELIRGGQRLFGLRTDLQFGPLAVTAVASQQDAETTDVTVDGGSQTTEFNYAPFEYEDNTHFFLGYFFHNWWDAAHERAGVISSPPGVNQVSAIEVWKFDLSLSSAQTNGDEIIYGLALADLAEPAAVLAGGEEYFDLVGTDAQRPDSLIDQYDPAFLQQLRTTTDRTALLAQREVPTSAYADTRFRRLTDGLDYTLDSRLGWLSLTTPLIDDDVLAVSYEYTTGSGENERRVYVGDFGQGAQSTTQNGPRTILKLLRGSRPAPAAPLWDLTMRNVYRVGGRGLEPSAFDLGIDYTAPSRPPADQLPTLSFGGLETLLQVFGLDRTNSQGAPPADNEFDFNGSTVDPGNGRIIFPVRQPFGSYLSTLIRTGESPLATGTVPRTVSEGSLDAAATLYSFDQMYEVPKSQARNLPGISRYGIKGQFRSATQSVFNIGFNIVPSTVVVTSGGRRLTEGSDYRVNVSAGTVDIINPTYLAEGQQIRIEAEQNRLFAIGSKTLLGLRADYRFSENAALGFTTMRLSERPLVDKFRVGEEALQNTIYGVDGRYLAEPRWMTRALDWLPLVQTSAPSRFELRGEVAQFNPGHPETLAFQRTQRSLADAPDNLSLTDDEQAGLSYVDDFEGSENSLSGLGETSGWRLAAAPDSAGLDLGDVTLGTPVTSVARPTNWRGLFAWYTINREVYREFEALVSPAARIVEAGQLYRDREFASETERRQPLPLLDLYFDPTQRGPYNYSEELGQRFATQPQDVWGGMSRPIDGSYGNFEGQNNVEFIEMLVAPLGGRNGTEPIAPGARLYIDLGRLSEDIIPDRLTNREDIIPDRPPTADELGPFGRQPGAGQPTSTVSVSRETGRTNDLGLDGLPSRNQDVAPGGQPYALDEQTHFAAFLEALPPDGAVRQRALNDPSADDYHHFGETAFFEDPRFFPDGATLQERFSRTFPAFELNSIQAYSAIVASGESGITSQPSTEDINGNGTANATGSYHRYELPLDEASLLNNPFVQSTITVGEQTFYLVRIPVRTQQRTELGGIGRDDFSSIEAIRLWTTGHDRAATLRIASFELVGSQWLKSTTVGSETDPGADEIAGEAPQLFIESINNEESPNVYTIPRAAIRSEARSLSGAATASREQSLVFRAETFADGRSAGIQRTYTSAFDLTRYTNLRMFVHGEQFDRSDSVRVFVRLGDDETQNYYEYEQPLYPFDSDPDAAPPGLTDNARSDSLWQTNVRLPDGTTVDRNSVNIVISELNLLKVARDDARASVEVPFERDGPPEGAPAGARIRIVGQPSVRGVRTIVLGIRNGRGGSDVPLDTVQVWFNELRVSGYDEASGSSGFLTANLSLADLATMSARMSFTQDGFGDLGSGLGTRTFEDRSAFAFTANLSAHKLLPERFGWSIPVTYTLNQSGSTPRYDPQRGDIRLDDLADGILNDDTPTALPEAERRDAADALIERAQTVTSSRNFRVQATKTGSRSPWLRYTVDGLSAAYSTNATDGRSPSNASNTSDQWTANLGYRVAVPRARTVRPLWFADGLPLLGSALGGLRLNWLPQSFTFTTDLNRSIARQQPRPQLAFSSEPDSVQSFRTLRRTTQTFGHGRTMDLQYNPLAFLRLSYGSDTDQNFDAAGRVESSRILVYRPATDSTAAFTQSYDLLPEQASDSASAVRRDLFDAFGIPTTGSLPGYIQILGGPRLDVVPFGEAIGNVFRGDGVRTSNYTQSLQATLSVSTRRVRWLSWVRPQAISYRTNYGWNDIAVPSNDPDLRVAGARTQVQLQTGLQLVPRDFWRLFPFYRRLEAAAGRAPAGPRAAVGGRPAAGAAPAGAATGATAAADSSRGFNPFAAVARLPRSLFLAATGITDVTATYRGSLSSAANGLLGGRYSLLSALTGDAPGLGYRLGFDRNIPIGARLNNDSLRLNLEDRLGDQHQLEGRTTLEPFSQLRIGLVMQTQWSRESNTLYSYTDPDPADGIEQFDLTAGDPNTRGSSTSTVYAFGGSYESLVARQVARYTEDIQGAPDASGRFTSEVLTRNGLASDFQAEFGRGLGRYGPGGFFPIPVPGWDVTYSGLSRWPVFRSLAQQVTLRHNYSATQQTGYTAFFSTTSPRPIGTTGVTLIPPAIDGASNEVTTLTANQAFQPLVGVQVTWKGGVQTTLNYERSDLYTLQTAAAQLTSKRIENLRLELTWAKTGFRLFGLRRLNNNLTFNLSASIFNDETLNRSLNSDVVAAITGTPLDDTEPIRTRRYQITPRLGYTISNRVTASVFVDYTRSLPSIASPTTDFDGGVSLRILFSN